MIDTRTAMALANYNSGVARARRAYWADSHCVSCGIRRRDTGKSLCWACRKSGQKVPR